jgi:sugar lactone lactonase YvrE
VNAELVLDARAVIGECPLWDSRVGVLWWVDIPAGVVHRYEPSHAVDYTINVGQDVGAVALRSQGGLVLALRNGFAVLDGDGAVASIARLDEDDPRLRLNDARCDSRGRLWSGTLRDDFASGVAALYRLDPDHSLHRMLDGVTISNGLDWSPDGAILYYADSATGAVDAFDFDVERGILGSRHQIVQLPLDLGIPDGLTVDVEGFLWIAVFGGGQVRRHAPDGRLDTVIELPVRWVTSCGFGGSNLERLYVTSGRERDPDAALAGGLFCAEPGVRGRPQHAFGG